MRKMTMVLFACSLLLIIFPSCGYAAIKTSSPLSIGQTLSSPGGFYELGFFSPNNTRNLYVGIWFKEIVPRVVVWVANRDKPVTNSAANLTISSSNGSLILLDGKQDVIWSTGEAFTSNKCHAELQDTGNLVVIDDVSRKTLWQSFENLGDTMVPQSSLMYDLSLGKKRVLTSWKSNSDPSPGGFSLEITPQVPLQGLIRRGSAPYWRTGPWAKTRFTGFPQFDESYVSPFSVVQDLAAGAGSFSYSTLRNFNLSYITLTPEGEMKIYWDQGKRWMHHVTEPEHSCDLYGACGPYDAWKDEFEPQDISGVNFFQMHTIRTATNNFSSSNKLGQGGFGPVYKGILLDGKEIAVKRLSSSSGQGTEEFMNEITLISKLQHRNLVRLLGYCIEREEKLLIYEFMVNKSLDIFLFDPTLKLEIDWPKRFNIIQGIARGLLYLHRDSRLRVIHRDLKVSNILLDEEMNPKISDFGLARMFQGTQFQYSTQRVAGTLGYMSPEYAWAGLFSEKSDIYSFGVLMLEIISGEKISRFTFGDERKGLVAYAWESWCESGGFNLLDRDLNHSCKAYEVSRCVQVGLLCVQHEAADRPNTLQVMSMITSTTDLPIPKQPIFAVQTQNVETSNDVSTMSKDLFSVNDLTHSVIQGR
ncbi:hypothetical protein F2Q68_00031656 [Brassica cretica]|uniref:Receptor-like serine/threonine-protein kinase n=1 Tax=Brassica cretica TaxID=69181 RepID=A0A8S9GK17_BRACR|nr:hypothetical protein F2Q68_00031656 [Brassica cretica]